MLRKEHTMTEKEVVRALRNCKAYKTKSDLQIAMIRAADLIESQAAEIAETKKREEAMLKDMADDMACGICVNVKCLVDDEPCASCCDGRRNFEWRGPQEAGKGEAE